MNLIISVQKLTKNKSARCIKRFE